MRLRRSDLRLLAIGALAVVGLLAFSQLNQVRVEKTVLELAHQAVWDYIGRPNEVIDSLTPFAMRGRGYTPMSRVEELPLPSYRVALPMDKITGYKVFGDVGPNQNYYTVYLEKQGRSYAVKSVQVDGWKSE